MNGHAEYILSILKSADKLIIPVYQRNYDWKESHCRTLFNDLVKTIHNNRKTHFFGGIVSANDPVGGRADLLIIDGQQRITTITLLLLALAKLLQESKVQSSDPYLADTIIKKYLADEINPNNRKIKLKPIKGDAEAFELLWQESDEYNRSSNVTLNYTYFYNRIQKGELSPNEIFDAIQRLQIIDISLKLPDDDPQLVFESLNSTGLDLSEGDKIRNYVLMGLPIEKQEQFYNQYWNPIERKAGYDKDSNSFNVSWFIRDFLSIKQRKIPSINSVYNSFKEYSEPFRNSDIEPLLQDLLNYAKRYEKLLNGFSDFPAQLNASVYRLNRFESSVTRPFLMEILRLKEQNVISNAETTEVFRTVESYLFRRIICDLPSNALNKVFLSLTNDVYRLDGTWDEFISKFKYILSSKKEKARFPDNTEFAEGLLQKNIYKMLPRYKAYLFERLENGDSLEYKAIYDRIDRSDYTIEHIIPQTLTPDWQEELGEEYERIHDTWLHRLANLTLSAYNTKYHNYAFEKKRTMKDGYLDSGLRMNQWIAQKTKWRETELEERAERLTKQAYGLWSYAESNYSPPEKQYDEYALDDDITFTGKIIVKYRFNGIEQEVQSWTEMYTEVIQTLHDKNKAILNYLADADDSVDLAIHLSRTESALTQTSNYAKAAKIDENIYIWVNTSTQYKINLLQKFFILFNEEQENLVFVVKEGSTASEDEAGRFALRREFWAQALPVIRETTGIFANVSAITSNTIQGASGCAGVYYNCVANYDNARIELYITTSNKAVNKAVFDALENQRREIENEYEYPLKWERMSDNLASKIYADIDDVSITDESDWPRMIRFLSENTAKLKAVCQLRLEAAYTATTQ